MHDCRHAGLREIAAPLLPNQQLIHSLATLLPSALQQAFLHQLKVRMVPKAAFARSALHH